MRLFGQFQGEVRRRPIPRTWVNRGKKKDRGIASRPLLELAKRFLRPRRWPDELHSMLGGHGSHLLHIGFAG